MADNPLADELTAAAKRLLSAAHGGVVDGDAVAHAIGRSPTDPAVYQAFEEIQARGTLTLNAWGSGHGLPHEVGGPRMN